MHRKFLNLLLVISVALGVALAQQPAPTNVPSVERLRAHIEYLASDKLEGRRTGSPGANLAAEYIAREFSRYGLRRSIGRDLPGMSILEADSPKRYMQEFPYVAGVELGKNNLFLLKSGRGGDAAPLQELVKTGCRSAFPQATRLTTPAWFLPATASPRLN